MAGVQWASQCLYSWCTQPPFSCLTHLKLISSFSIQTGLLHTKFTCRPGQFISSTLTTWKDPNMLSCRCRISGLYTLCTHVWNIWSPSLSVLAVCHGAAYEGEAWSAYYDSADCSIATLWIDAAVKKKLNTYWSWSLWLVKWKKFPSIIRYNSNFDFFSPHTSNSELLQILHFK